MRKTNWKLEALLAVTALLSTGSVFAQPSRTVYVNSLIKCHEAKFDFDDATGELNAYFMAGEVGDYAGTVNTGVPGQINPDAQQVAIQAPFWASAPTFIKDTHGVLWACVTLNSLK